MGDAIIRRGAAADLPALTDLYNYYVETSHVTFDTEVFSVAARRAWFAQFSRDGAHRIFVAAKRSHVLGFACSTCLKEKPGYDISVETTVYLYPDAIGDGLGARLLKTLLEALADTQVHGAYAAIALPNPASIALHERLGFRQVGILREVGIKFGRLTDIAWYERRVRPGT